MCTSGSSSTSLAGFQISPMDRMGADTSGADFTTKLVSLHKGWSMPMAWLSADVEHGFAVTAVVIGEKGRRLGLSPLAIIGGRAMMGASLSCEGGAFQTTSGSSGPTFGGGAESVSRESPSRLGPASASSWSSSQINPGPDKTGGGWLTGGEVFSCAGGTSVAGMATSEPHSGQGAVVPARAAGTFSSPLQAGQENHSWPGREMKDGLGALDGSFHIRQPSELWKIYYAIGKMTSLISIEQILRPVDGPPA